MENSTTQMDQLLNMQVGPTCGIVTGNSTGLVVRRLIGLMDVRSGELMEKSTEILDYLPTWSVVT